LNSYAFLPFGEKVSSSETVTNPFTYVGQFGVRDEGNSLYFMRNRWYDPKLGRFTSPDPLGIGGGDSNLYSYVANSATNLVDPLGLEPGGKYNPINNIPGGSDSVSRYRSNKDYLEIGRQNARQTYDPINSIPNAGGNLPDYYHGDTIGGKNIDTLKLIVKNETDSPTWNTIEKVHKFGADVYNAPSWTQRRNLSVWAINKTSDKVGATVKSGISNGVYYYHWLGSKLPNVPSLWSPQKQKPTKVPNSSDPNLKTTVGYGSQGFVTGDTPLVYTIDFENQASASAPAQKIVVTDQLNANLDWSTMQLVSVGFNNTNLSIPSGLQNFTAQTTVPTDPNPVKINASFNPATGLITWTMESIDPVTGSVPADPYAGFLPPNDSTHQGDGYVVFTVKSKPGLSNGTSFTNKATIVFDVNAPIDTNVVTNTIDSTKPSSWVNLIPSNTVTDSFTVSWTGNDTSGSGISYYDIYASIDGGAYSVWLPGTSLTSALYGGLSGHTYSFYSMAVDNVGNRQSVANSAQLVITGNLPLVQVDSSLTPYRSILAAIAASGNNSVIKVRNAGFSENVVFNFPNSVTLSGGYGDGFSSIAGYTTVQGTVTVQRGILNISNLIIQ
jgi:RHS repeat-associated protein